MAIIKYLANRKNPPLLVKNLNYWLLLILLLFPGYASFKANTLLIENSPKEVIDQVWQIIYRDYMDISNVYSRKKWMKLRNKLLSANYENSIDSYEAIRAMLLTLEDPYTRFLDPKEFNEMRIDTSGELTGIGIQISIDELTKDIIVVAPIEGTPAFEAGIQ